MWGLTHPRDSHLLAELDFHNNPSLTLLLGTLTKCFLINFELGERRAVPEPSAQSSFFFLCSDFTHVREDIGKLKDKFIDELDHEHSDPELECQSPEAAKET